jgi:hypothetical protein
MEINLQASLNQVYRRHLYDHTLKCAYIWREQVSRTYSLLPIPVVVSACLLLGEQTPTSNSLYHAILYPKAVNVPSAFHRIR